MSTGYLNFFANILARETWMAMTTTEILRAEGSSWKKRPSLGTTGLGIL